MPDEIDKLSQLGLPDEQTNPTENSKHLTDN